MPVGLGIFGVALERHLSWVVLAVGHALVTFAALNLTPVTTNYLAECFTKNVEESAVILTAYRLLFGLSIAFYIADWVARVGFAWSYGTMAFITLSAWVFVGVLMWRGHRIRGMDPFRLISSEEGEKVVEKTGRRRIRHRVHW
jgi:hypothetical protein